MPDTQPSAVWEAEEALESHWQARATWIRDVLGVKGWKDPAPTPEEIGAELAALDRQWPMVPERIQRTILQAIGADPGRLSERWATLPQTVRRAILQGIGGTLDTLASAAKCDALEQQTAGSRDRGRAGGRPSRRGGWTWKRR